MDVTIFIVRSLLTVLLYAFLGTLLFFLWRDVKLATRQRSPAMTRERPGQLRVLHGNDGLAEGAIVKLSPFTTIGRAESNTITISDPYASAEHALIAWRSSQWWLEDRDSRNGTLLNDFPVEEPLIIGHGDVIGIGQMRFKFEYTENGQV